MKEPETLVLPLHHPAKSLKRGEYKQRPKSWQYYIPIRIQLDHLGMVNGRFLPYRHKYDCILNYNPWRWQDEGSLLFNNDHC